MANDHAMMKKVVLCLEQHPVHGADHSAQGGFTDAGADAGSDLRTSFMIFDLDIRDRLGLGSAGQGMLVIVGDFERSVKRRLQGIGKRVQQTVTISRQDLLTIIHLNRGGDSDLVFAQHLFPIADQFHGRHPIDIGFIEQIANFLADQFLVLAIGFPGHNQAERLLYAARQLDRKSTRLNSSH